MTDSGNYTAVAENPNGTTYSSSQVLVKEPTVVDTSVFGNVDTIPTRDKRKNDLEDLNNEDIPLNLAKPPKVNGFPNLDVLEGETAEIPCKIEGFPRPKVYCFYTELFMS